MKSEDTHIPAFATSTTGNITQDWKPLRQFNTYRLVLAIGFLVGFYNVDWLNFLGSRNPQTFLLAALLLVASSIVYTNMAYRKKPGFESQVIISNASDILLITILSYSSGGLSSSLPLLMIINVTATGTFLRSRDSILFASLAAIAVLSEQTFSLIQGVSEGIEYTRAGLLGLVFFGTSFLASTLSQRVRESEQLADERKEDIISLEKLNEDIIQNMRTGIIVVDDDGYIRMANSSAENLLGSISLKNKPLLENILPALDARFLEWQKQPNMHHKAIRQEHGLPDIQAGFRKLKRTGERTGETLIFLEDATQLNQRFQQIKLASLGRLTASIAHEIRNPLSAINHAAQLLQESDLEEPDKNLTTIITTQVQRLDKVVENVLQLSRQQKSEADTIELNSWLENFINEFLQSSKIKPKQIQLIKHNEEVFVLFDAGNLYQVMNNLCNNAISHSNKSINNIKIQIECGYDEQSEQPYINVIDNGPGISDEIIEQVFDPFFTTSSRGTGLGLYITKEMIESNRGRIRYISNREGGYFKIHFLQYAFEGPRETDETITTNPSSE